MRSKIIILVILGLFLSCNHDNKKEDNTDNLFIESNIDNMLVVYYRYLAHQAIPIECGMLPYTADIGNEEFPDCCKPFADTILRDKELLKEIEKEILLLKVDTTMKYNLGGIQIQCFINYKDSTTDILCLTGFSGMCFLNGKPLIDNGYLNCLIKKNIGYSHQPSFKWLPIDPCENDTLYFGF